MPPIGVMIKPSSGKCNMRCDYCFYIDEQANRARPDFGFMEEKTLKNIIRRTLLHAEGAASYAFQGGEPTLRGLDFFRKAVEYQKQYNRNHVRIQNSIQTNGLLLDREWCAFLREKRFLTGVSLDGTREVHNRFRHLRNEEGSASSFDLVLERIHLLQEEKVEFNILTVVTDETAAHIEEIYDFFRKEGFFWQQYIACLDPMDQTEASRDRPRLSQEDYGRFLVRLWDLWEKDENRPYIRQFDNWIGIELGVPPEACDMRGVCGMQYVCEADGSVYPCDFYMTDGYRLGNFNEERMDSVDARRTALSFIEESRHFSEKCGSCPYLRFCRGGCRRNRENGLNRFCESYRMFFDQRLDELRKTAHEMRLMEEKR